MRWISRRLSYANVVASMALFFALTGGAYAVVGNPSANRAGGERPARRGRRGGRARWGTNDWQVDIVNNSGVTVSFTEYTTCTG